jgi:hypothetical protein
MDLNLTAFEAAVKTFLDNLAKEDEMFSKNYAKPNKSISECCKYIFQQVEKNRKNNERCVACTDEEVYGLAIHYYDEDDIKVDGPKNTVEKVQCAQEPKSSSEKPKAKSKAKAKSVQTDPDLPESLEIPLF